MTWPTNAVKALSVTNDTTYADSGTDASVKIHQQDHDTIATALQAAPSTFAPYAQPWQFRVESYGAKGDGTTDDSAAIQAAIDAAFAYANSSHGYYAEVLFQPVKYLVAGPYQTKYYGNAQIAIPYQGMTQNKVTLVLRGGVDASAFPIWTQSATAENATVLFSTGAGGATDATNGDYCVVGGPAYQQGFGNSGATAKVGPDAGSQNVWDNLLLVVDGISVVVPTPANQAAFQFQTLAEVTIGSVSVFANAGPAGTSYVMPSNQRAIGLAMPNDYNNANSTIRNYSCEGFYIGLILGEHTVAEAVRTMYCHTGIYVANLAHYSVVKWAMLELCTVGIDHNGHADFLMADFEDNSAVGSAFATQFYVHATSAAAGVIRYFNMQAQTTLINQALLSIDDATYVRLVDARPKMGYYDTAPTVPTSGNYLLNPYFRDAQVTLAGGTVSKVEVYSPGTSAAYKTVATATGTTFFLPSMSYVRLTYARTVTDGATTASSTTVTSATANFTAADVGASISGGSIPAGATVASVTNSTTVVISAAATATATAVSLTVLKAPTWTWCLTSAA